MHHLKAAVFLIAASCAALGARAAGEERAGQAWVRQSNGYTNMLLDVQLAHAPEQGSHQGVAKFDQSITDPTRADELVARREFEAVLVKIKAARAAESDKHVRQ